MISPLLRVKDTLDRQALQDAPILHEENTTSNVEYVNYPSQYLRTGGTHTLTGRSLSVLEARVLNNGPRPLNSTGRHGLFLNSTCDIRLSDMRHGGKKDSDMRHGYFLNSTCDMVENKGQRHATLAFLKIDMQHQDPPSRAPQYSMTSSKYRGFSGCIAKKGHL